MKPHNYYLGCEPDKERGGKEFLHELVRQHFSGQARLRAGTTLVWRDGMGLTTCTFMKYIQCNFLIWASEAGKF